MTSQLKAFIAKAMENTELKSKLDALAQIHEDQRKDAVIAIAQEAGFTLTTEDFAQPSNEMDDDELEAVAGGYEKCMCVVGGGGKKDADGKVCWCVVSGDGDSRDGRQRCACPALGLGDTPIEWSTLV